MLDPETLDLTPDGSQSGEDVVLFSRYADLVQAYRELYEAYVSVAPTKAPVAMRDLTLREKIQAMYPRNSYAVIVERLYLATEPVPLDELMGSANIAHSARHTFLSSMRRTAGVTIVNNEQRRYYDAATDRALTISLYSLGAQTRQELDSALAHPAVAYHNDGHIVTALLTAMSKYSPRDRVGLNAVEAQRISALASVPLAVIRVVLRRMALNGMIALIHTNGQSYRLTSDGHARLRALECSTQET